MARKFRTKEAADAYIASLREPPAVLRRSPMPGVTIIPPAKVDPHSCRKNLPAAKGGYGATTYERGTLLVCSCDHAWVVDGWWDGEQIINVWRGLYWTERKLRRRAKDVIAGRRADAMAGLGGYGNGVGGSTED